VPTKPWFSRRASSWARTRTLRARSVKRLNVEPVCRRRAWVSFGQFRSDISSLVAVAYDEVLAARIRELLIDEHVVEKKLFGGLASLIQGNMAIAASGQGGVMVRVDPAQSERLVKTSNAEPMVMPRQGDGGMVASGIRGGGYQASTGEVGEDRFSVRRFVARQGQLVAPVTEGLGPPPLRL
jgi:hypothetical protein